MFRKFLSTPIPAIDKAGSVVWSANYEAFGKATITTPNPTQEKPTIISNLRFPGQYEDEETGLHYNFNRYYDVETGRYITSDPLRLRGGINSYVYTNGSPSLWVDSTGERYSSADCELLKQWIADQWKVFWVYFDRALTGKVTTGIQSLTHTENGCYSLYPDEGRRLACIAHEKAHDPWLMGIYIATKYPSTILNPSKMYGPNPDPEITKLIAQDELNAGKVGIETGEKLYSENCVDCDGM